MDNLLQEYVLYRAFRTAGIPTHDVVGFAEMKVVSGDRTIDQNKLHRYMLLQRSDEENDQIPLTTQYGFSEVIDQPPAPFTRTDRERSNKFTKIVLQEVEESERREGEGFDEWERRRVVKSEKELLLDPEASIRYALMNELLDLEDRGLFHNADYGLHAASNKWKTIPYDMDLSLGCGRPFVENVARLIRAEVPMGQQAAYYALLARTNRELFETPELLHQMLAFVDSYPFEDNKEKMKNTLKWRFYYAALTAGSAEFAREIGQPHVSYIDEALYLKEARRILQTKDYDTICTVENDYMWLRDFVDEGKAEGNLIAAPAPVHPRV